MIWSRSLILHINSVYVYRTIILTKKTERERKRSKTKEKRRLASHLFSKGQKIIYAKTN